MVNQTNITERKVATLLAAYNGDKFLMEQIESIQNQYDVVLDVYISVDLSTDKTFDLCQELISEYKNIYLLPYGGTYGGAAKNFFRLFRDVNFEDYDYVALADQDDIWHIDKLSSAVDALNNYEVDAYSSNVTAFWNDGRKQLIDKSQPQRMYDYLFEAAGPGCTYVFSNKLASAFKGFLIDNPESNEFVLHDWLLYAFARSHGYKWFIDPAPYMEYRQHEKNQVGVNNSVASMIHRMKYVLFGDGFAQVKSIIVFFEVNPFYNEKKFGRWQILKMIPHFSQFRRKPIERIYVLFALIISLIFGVNDK